MSDIKICPECGKEKELTIETSVQTEEGRSHSIHVLKAICEECLQVQLWASIISNDNRRMAEWTKFAKERGINSKRLEFEPRYPKLIAVKDREYCTDVCESETFEVGFKMNEEDFSGVVHVYKGCINHARLLEIKSKSHKYTREEGPISSSTKIVEIVERKLIPKLTKKISPFILGKLY